MVSMFFREGARIPREQRRALSTWLLEGHPPEAHMVADLDEPEAEVFAPSRQRRGRRLATRHWVRSLGRWRTQRTRQSNRAPRSSDDLMSGSAGLNTVRDSAA
jgi:hypothetical protein